ncbi:methyltransferase domain-containing protein [Altererythrobacter sp. Z27]|uniref:methyltransferase domain-containing protein n=1 Tax=Altererythrobacter sp. Z27 TaxID=3461147 RepID=UPI004043BDC2
MKQALSSLPTPQFATPHQPRQGHCRFCDASLQDVVVDLGMSPLCQSVVTLDRAREMEPFYPLVVYLCRECLLVQLEEFVPPENIFTEYAYFSAFSDSWVEHGRKYTEMIVDRLALDESSHVVEIASNDGYLLQHFVARSIPVLGIDPAANVASDAEKRGVPTLVEFFGSDCAQRLRNEGKQADLIIGNNVLAQIHNINDFVQGLALLLKSDGIVTIEVPHLVRLMDQNQFDTIYHEHFSYFSVLGMQHIFGANGLQIFDVEELTTHGGSLRIYARHEHRGLPVTDRLSRIVQFEEDYGLRDWEAYASFANKVEATKRALLSFLIEAKAAGKSVVGYGAPGKGNTLLNYCGIRTDFLDYTVDRNPYKQGKLLPGTHIPIYPPERIAETKPDYVLILPWNIKDEIIAQNAYVRDWGGQFVVPIPEVTVIP